METVFLTEHIHNDAIAYLKENFKVVQGTSIAEDDIIKQAQGCSAILIRSAHITAKVMDSISTLKVIAKHGIGVDNIDVDYATQKGILVVNAPFSNLNAVAEQTVALIMGGAKHLALMDRITREGGFKRRNEFINLELMGKTAGLIGFGRIGAMVAKKLKALDMNVIAYDPYMNEEKAAELGVTTADINTVLETADFVTIHTQLIPATRNLMDMDKFKKMKKTAWFINLSRGGVMVEPDLIEALKTGEIAGTALDVFAQEPPADDNPLFSMDNVIVSPHNAALTDRAMVAMAMDSATGITEYLMGKPVTWPVNRAVLEK